jgi:hypothetical protein
MIEQASLVIGNCNWANKEGSLLGYKLIDGKYYPREMDAVRATTATRINAQGLVELVPYNLVSYSQNFSNAAWIKVDTTITANSTTAPDGTLTANKFESNAAGVPQLSQSISGTNTISIYAKAGNISNFRMWIGSEVIFDLSNGSVISGTATIEDAGSGWYRCIISSTNAGAFNPYFVASASGQFVYVWGAQAVEGSTAKDYQKTETRLNIPRLDYSNGTCPSLLVEPQRTNSCLYSEDITNAAWGEFGASTIANTTIAPSGVTNADTILPSATTATHGIFQQITIAGGVYTASAYFKANGYNYACIRIATNSDSTRYGVVMSLIDGSVTATDSSGSPTNTSYSIETAENGWFRLSVSCSHSTGFIYHTIGVSNVAVPTFLNSLPSFTANGTSGIYIWGAQVEAGSYPTSYIPTTSASVTRNADVISKTGISSLIGQTEGTMFFDGFIGNSDSEMFLFLQAAASSGVDNSIYFQKNSSQQVFFRVFDGTSIIVNIGSGIYSIGDRVKIAASYKANDFVFYINGTQIGTATSGTPPTCANVQLASYAGAPTNENFIANGGIYAVALWQTRLDNATLASLTTL